MRYHVVARARALCVCIAGTSHIAGISDIAGAQGIAGATDAPTKRAPLKPTSMKEVVYARLVQELPYLKSPSQQTVAARASHKKPHYSPRVTTSRQ